MNIDANPQVGEEKFVLFSDLGVLRVPDNYDHASRLGTFARRFRENFRSYDPRLVDENFSNPTRIMTAGDEFKVKLFRQNVPPGHTTTTSERMRFLLSQEVVFTGAQGLSLALEVMGNIPEVFGVYSFDQEDRLLWDKGKVWIPRASLLHKKIVHFGQPYGLQFSLGHFESQRWLLGSLMICFFESKD